MEGWKGGREARVRRLIGGTRATELYSWCPVIETHRIEFVTDQQGGGQPVRGGGRYCSKRPGNVSCGRRIARLDQWPLKCRSRIFAGGGRRLDSDGRGYNHHHTHVFVSTRTTSSTPHTDTDTDELSFLFFCVAQRMDRVGPPMTCVLMHELGFY